VKLSSPNGIALKWTANVLLLLLGIVFVLPLVWVVLASFDGAATLSVGWPKEWTLENFHKVLTPELAFLPLWNSLLLSAGCAIATVVVAILAAYPLSRYPTRFNRPFLYVILFGTSLPITAMMVPVYSLFVSLSLIDSLGGTILFMAASSLPIAIWMTKNFVDSVPISLEEAAWVDGASSMKTLWTVVVPLVRPGIAVVFIYVFVAA
jgi:multiple sugar transport system permease protein